MRQAILALGAVATLASCACALAQQAPAEGSPTYYAAANCANCHGTDGRATSIIPPLAGRDRAELEEALLGFKAATRPATIMHQIAKGYSDDELKAFAAYFAAQK